MKKVIQALFFVAIGALSSTIAHAERNKLACIKAYSFPAAQLRELDCYSDFDVMTRDGYQCFIKFAESKNIKRQTIQSEPEEWIAQEAGEKKILSTHPNKLRQPQVLIFTNAGVGEDKINVEVLSAKNRKYAVDDIAKAIGADEAQRFEDTVNGLNALKEALGRPDKNCPSPYSVFVD